MFASLIDRKIASLAGNNYGGGEMGGLESNLVVFEARIKVLR
jgi:hypothetical protein